VACGKLDEVGCEANLILDSRCHVRIRGDFPPAVRDFLECRSELWTGLLGQDNKVSLEEVLA